MIDYLLYLFFMYGPVAVAFTCLFTLITFTAIDALQEADNAIDSLKAVNKARKISGKGTIVLPYRFWMEGTNVHAGEWWEIKVKDAKLVLLAVNDGIPKSWDDCEFWVLHSQMKKDDFIIWVDRMKRLHGI